MLPMRLRIAAGGGALGEHEGEKDSPRVDHDEGMSLCARTGACTWVSHRRWASSLMTLAGIVSYIYITARRQPHAHSARTRRHWLKELAKVRHAQDSSSNSNIPVHPEGQANAHETKSNRKWARFTDHTLLPMKEAKSEQLLANALRRGRPQPSALSIPCNRPPTPAIDRGTRQLTAHGNRPHPSHRHSSLSQT